MNKRKKGIITLVVAAVLLIAVWLLFFRKKEKPLLLQTEKPQVGYIAKSVTATGTIQPVDTVAVGTQVSGTLAFLYTDFNKPVKKGQLLGMLDQSLFQASVDQYKANLAVAQSQYTYQQQNFHRQELLYKTGAIAKADYDNAMYTLNSAKANVESVKAQLTTAEKNLYFSHIYSPIDGVVLNRSVSVGQTVAASFSTPTLFTIAKDITKMQVQANVDEADIGNVDTGQRATFTVDAFIEDVFQGSVEEIRLRSSTSSNVVTYTTIINAPNNDMKLKPGMTANIVIYTKEVNDALLISVKALKYEPDEKVAKKFTLIPADTSQSPASSPRGNAALEKSTDTTNRKIKDSSQIKASSFHYVWVKQGNKLMQKKIATGLNNDTQVQVLSGLTAADEVVTAASEASDTAPAAGSSGTKSPFMPSRPGRKK